LSVTNKLINDMELKKLIEEAVEGLNWDIIRHICLKTKCDWFSIDPSGHAINKGKVERISIDAMKQDLRKVIRYAFANNADSQLYMGPWMVEWAIDSEDYGSGTCNALTVEFIITSVTVCDSTEGDELLPTTKVENEDNIRQQMEDAVASEDYQAAAALRDKLQKMSSK